MTPDQALTLILRGAAAVVWLLYLVRIVVDPEFRRLRTLLVVFVAASYALTQAWRSIVAPSGTLWEFTALSVMSLIIGLALLTTWRNR